MQRFLSNLDFARASILRSRELWTAIAQSNSETAQGPVWWIAAPPPALRRRPIREKTGPRFRDSGWIRCPEALCFARTVRQARELGVQSHEEQADSGRTTERCAQPRRVTDRERAGTDYHEYAIGEASGAPQRKPFSRTVPGPRARERIVAPGHEAEWVYCCELGSDMRTAAERAEMRAAREVTQPICDLTREQCFMDTRSHDQRRPAQPQRSIAQLVDQFPEGSGFPRPRRRRDHRRVGPEGRFTSRVYAQTAELSPDCGAHAAK